MEFFNNEIFDISKTLSVYHDRTEYRKLTLQRLKELFKSGLIDKNFDIKKYIQLFNHLHLIDGSLSVKVGVNFGLFGISILNLGTHKHQHLLEKLVEGKIFGCFAMTEVNHGSDVKSLKTTATYQPETHSFVIETNGKENRKCWIGNTFDATHSIVFAQLIIDDKSYGIHAFVVPIDNVKKTDLGDKYGLQGVDNGMLEFNSIQIPYENLLDKFSSIENGKFKSEFSENQRFGQMLSALTLGRLAISSGVLQYAKKGIYITLKYLQERKQFSFDGKNETTILEYPNVQQQLIPKLCSMMVYHQMIENLIDIYGKNREKVHKITSGCKPIFTWFAVETLQQCREFHGGNGYLLDNLIGMMKNDAEIYTTFEGDNHMLLQQLGKIILTKYYQKKLNTDFKLTQETIDELPMLIKCVFHRKLSNTISSMKRYSKKERNINVVWNKHQKEIIEFSKIYMEYKLSKIDHFLVYSYGLIFKYKFELLYYKNITEEQLERMNKSYQIEIKKIVSNIDEVLDSFQIKKYMIKSKL